MIMSGKNTFFIILIVLFLITGFTWGEGNEIVKKFDSAPGKKLEVDLKAGGSIKITGTEKNQVNIIVRFKNGDAGMWKTDFRQTAEGIEVNSNYPGKNSENSGSPSFEFQVPSKYDIKLKTMGGSVFIEGVNGKISGRTMGGDLKFTRLKGVIEFKTMGGEISLKESDLDGKLITMGGRIMFENVVGDVSGTSMGGNVIYKNVKTRTGKTDSGAVNISTMGGDINLSEAPNGAKVSTKGGDIHIKSAKNFIIAKTMGGDIKVESIDGWIDAETMGGDIRVIMTGDPAKGKRDVILMSMGGDIALHVPSGLSMDIEIELSYTKKSSKNYKISGNIDLKQTTTGIWDESHGTPRKTIYGKAKTRDGANKIKIKTINGNISLKEI